MIVSLDKLVVRAVIPTVDKSDLLVSNNHVVLFEKLDDIPYKGWPGFLGLYIITLGMSKTKEVS